MPYMLFKLLEVITRSFNTKFDLDRVRKFRDRNALNPAIYDALNKAVENVKINMRWYDNNFDKISKWLQLAATTTTKPTTTITAKE